jgi:Tol biopolymer transport system component
MRRLLLTFTSSALILLTHSQNDVLTAKDYQQAESMMGYNTQKYIDRGNVAANWFGNDRFWYRVLTPQGSEFVVVDAAKGVKTVAFDHQKLATLLNVATGRSYTAAMLPFQSISYTDDGNAIVFRADGKQWKYAWKANTVTADTSQVRNNTAGQGGGRFRGGGLEVRSPDGSKAAYIKEYNLWVRDIKSGQQTQLTRDGIKDFGYATDNAGWTSSDRPVLRWSPDSKKIATFKQDQRNVGDMYLTTTNVGHPTLKEWKYPLPGDKDIPMIHRCIIDVEQQKVIMFNLPPDPHRASLSDDISSSGTFDDVDWNPDGTELAFLSTSRDHKNEKMRIANALTGEVREVFEETVATQYESGQGAINWRYLPRTKEFIWYSERDDWGHLYLYDAATGKQKHQITKGNYVVLRMTKVDEKNRVIYFIANCLQTENPYFSQFCKIVFD